MLYIHSLASFYRPNDFCKIDEQVGLDVQEFRRGPAPGEIWGPGIHQVSFNDKLFENCFE